MGCLHQALMREEHWFSLVSCGDRTTLHELQVTMFAWPLQLCSVNWCILLHLPSASAVLQPASEALSNGCTESGSSREAGGTQHAQESACESSFAAQARHLLYLAGPLILQNVFGYSLSIVAAIAVRGCVHTCLLAGMRDPAAASSMSGSELQTGG